MALKHLEAYRDADIAEKLIEKIKAVSKKKIRLMEVCGTHTVSIFRSGIRSVLPETITLLSGPGCPVCVTAQGEIDAFIQLAKTENVIVATFGDLMRVPGTGSSLQKERGAGHDIRMVYSTMDALEIAKKNPDKEVVFLGVGFETTAPTIAASVLTAKETGVENFSIISTHKLVPPALSALAASDAVNIDGFILPGHVSVIIGTQAYRPFFEETGLPCVVAGFEPADILQAIAMLAGQISSGTPKLENAYRRAVTPEGNPKAQQILDIVFEPGDAEWRGIGTIPGSGLKLKEAFTAFDAVKRFNIETPKAEDPKGCGCGEILLGVKTPPECPLYKRSCTPMDPIGPCMVSTEGTCAAYYRYHTEN